MSALGSNFHCCAAPGKTRSVGHSRHLKLKSAPPQITIFVYASPHDYTRIGPLGHFRLRGLGVLFQVRYKTFNFDRSHLAIVSSYVTCSLLTVLLMCTFK